MLLAGCDLHATPTSAVGPSADAVSLRVLPEQLELRPRDVAGLQAQADDAVGRPVGGAPFAFRSDDQRLVTVDERGRVVALGPAGNTRIIVTSATLERAVPVRVVHGPPTLLQRISGDGQRVAAGAALAEPLVVRAADAADNAVGGVPVTFAIAGAAGLSSDARTDGAGSASWQPELPTTAGPLRVAVTLAAPRGDTPPATVTFEITVEAAAPARLRDAGAELPEQTSAAPALLRGAVRLTDDFGNPRAGAAIAWIVGAGCGTIVTSDSATTADGMATLSLQRPSRPSRTACSLSATADEGRLETAVKLR
jgi:hypothetical protein